MLNIKSILAVFIILLLAGALYAIYRSNSLINNQNTSIVPGIGGGPNDLISGQESKTFEVSGKSYEFTPKEMRVKNGDTVNIIFKNEEGFHDLVLDEFNVRTKQIQAVQTDTIQFVANKTGTFEYYCSVGNHRQMGMVGKLIVE